MEDSGDSAKCFDFHKSNRRAAQILSLVGFVVSPWGSCWWPGDIQTFRTAAVIFILSGCIQTLWDGSAAAFLLGQDMKQGNVELL